MTVIVPIYAAIANMAPTWDSDVAIKVWNGSLFGVIKNTLPSAQVPIRILTTVGESTGRDFGFIALGKLSKIVWVIEDLLLMKPQAEGDGIKSMSSHTIAYVDSYITALRNLRSPAAGSHVLAANFKPGTEVWGDTRYFSVRATLEIEEFQSGS